MEITFEKKLSVAKEFIKNKNATYLGYKEINKKICIFYYCNKHKEYGMIYNTLDTFIEYRGEQHYFPVNFRGRGSKDYLDEFKNNQIRDNIKREYCKDNKITLIEIPYTEKNNISDILKQYNIYA